MNLFIIRGLPGSGKTTMANRIGESIMGNWTHYEADMYFEDSEGNYKFNRKQLREAHEWCYNKTDRDLEHNYTVIVSNTFTTIKELRPYFQLSLKYCITPTVITLHNNWGSIHNVPEETLLEMRKRFEYDISKLFKEHDAAIDALSYGYS